MQDDVKRWNLDIPDAGVYPHADGEYVLASDYDRLRAERDALAASHARLVAAISKIRRGDFPDSEQPLWDELSTALSLARDLPADGDKEPRP